MTISQRRAAIDGANEHLNAGRIAEALAITTKLVLREPTSAESQEIHALVLLADAGRLDELGADLDANKKRTAALRAYEAACGASTDPGLLQLSTAQLAHMLGEVDVALLYYKQAHDNVSNDGRAAFFIAQLYLQQEEWHDAKHWIDASLKRNQNEPFALLSSGLIEAELGNKTTAKSLAIRGCQIQPNDHNLRFMQARIMRLIGEPQHAIEILASLPHPFKDSSFVLDEKSKCVLAIEGNNYD